MLDAGHRFAAKEMGDSWSGAGVSGLRRRTAAVGGQPVGPGGAPAEGLRDPPTRQSTLEEAKTDESEEETPARRGGPSSFALVSCYTATLSVLFLACAVGGCFLGILISRPQLKAVEAGVEESPGASKLVLKDDGDFLLFGGLLFFPLQLHNSSSFSLSFHVSEFDVYYYPIGASRQCLLYHGGTLLSLTSPAFQYRQKFGTPENGSWGSIAAPDNEIQVKTSEGSEYATSRLDLPWRVGLRIPKSSTESLDQLKALADDCEAYGSVVLGAEITEGFTRSFLTDVGLPGAVHIVQAVNCTVSPTAKLALASRTRAYSPVFLEGLENDPNLFISEGVLST
ncbi:hypothetical protein Efla_003632 [Eimeria flavescens]